MIYLLTSCNTEERIAQNYILIALLNLPSYNDCITKICNRNKNFFNFWTNKVEIRSVINRWKSETNGQKKFSLTTYYIWMEEPIHHFDFKHLQLWLAY